MLRANIEKKMQKIEILIKDLSASKAQMELERGKKITKEKIIDFIAEMLKGNTNDKDIKNKPCRKRQGYWRIKGSTFIVFGAPTYRKNEHSIIQGKQTGIVLRGWIAAVGL